MARFFDMWLPMEIKPDEPHNVRFKERQLTPINECVKYTIEKPVCEICGATEETNICNRTFTLK